MTEDWGEHVRQHARVTKDDRAAEEHVRSLTEPGKPPVIRHFLSAEALAARASMQADPAAATGHARAPA